MTRKVGEVHFSTAEQVKGYLDEALRIVTELELDGELRVPAFLKAADLLSGKQVLMEQVQANALGILNRG